MIQNHLSWFPIIQTVYFWSGKYYLKYFSNQRDFIFKLLEGWRMSCDTHGGQRRYPIENVFIIQNLHWLNYFQTLNFKNKIFLSKYYKFAMVSSFAWGDYTWTNGGTITACPTDDSDKYCGIFKTKNFKTKIIVLIQYFNTYLSYFLCISYFFTHKCFLFWFQWGCLTQAEATKELTDLGKVLC